MNTQQLIDNVRSWGEDKGITGTGGKATVVSQLLKLFEEVEEIQQAIETNDIEELADGIGDSTVVLILLSEIAGLKYEDCLQGAYDIISKRTGRMVDGTFVKDK
jgi:NTP pyrophosphatase (non-canonical NTP hydrolase)